MPIDTATPRSPGWWLQVLGRKLHDRRHGTRWSPMARHRRDIRPGIDLLDDYLRGDPPLPNVAEGWADAMRPFIRQSRMNYAELIVEAPRDRMIPLGWATAIDNDENGDQVAARIAAANEMELRTADTFLWMLGLGDGYMMVGAPRANGIPVISAEDPREVITANDPATGESIAALKVFRDEWTGDEFAYVYLPGEVWVARKPFGLLDGPGFFGQAWEWDAQLSGTWPRGFADLVPVVRFRNRAGRGEFETHLDVLDRINDEIFSRVAISKYQAFRQRGIKGLEPTDPQGVEIDYSEIFTADPGAFWQLPESVEIWESSPVDLGPIRLAVKDDVEGLCAVTRTPLFYVTPDAAAGSAEGASTQREGLVYRTEDRRRRAAAALARVMSLAFLMMGETDRADVLSIRTLWQPAERYSLTARASAAAQLNGILPWRQNMRDTLQYRPEELAGLERERDADLADKALEAELLAGANTAQNPGPPIPATPVVPVPPVVAANA